MYAKVTQLRDKGRRRREQDIAADVGMRGRIQAFIVEGYPVMHFFEWGSQAVGTADLLFPLYQPQIIGLRDRAMMVRGWQREEKISSPDGLTPPFEEMHDRVAFNDKGLDPPAHAYIGGNILLAPAPSFISKLGDFCVHGFTV